MHIVDITSTTYLPRLVKVVKERPPRPGYVVQEWTHILVLEDYMVHGHINYSDQRL